MNNKLLELKEQVKNGDFDDNELIDLVLQLDSENQILFNENVAISKKNKKIDKAIKYIEDRMILEQSFCLDMKQCTELKEILKEVE